MAQISRSNTAERKQPVVAAVGRPGRPSHPALPGLASGDHHPFIRARRSPANYNSKHGPALRKIFPLHWLRVFYRLPIDAAAKSSVAPQPYRLATVNPCRPRCSHQAGTRQPRPGWCRAGPQPHQGECGVCGSRRGAWRKGCALRGSAHIRAHSGEQQQAAAALSCPLPPAWPPCARARRV